MVADALSQKEVNMGSLTSILAFELSLGSAIYFLSDMIVQLDILPPKRIITSVEARFTLLE